MHRIAVTILVLSMVTQCSMFLNPGACYCPVGCNCQNNCTYAMCADKSMSEIPVGFDSSRLNQLWFIKTELSSLTKDSGLLRLKALKQLKFKRNKLQRLTAGALNLPNLEKLILMEYNLQYLQPGFLNGLRYLKVTCLKSFWLTFIKVVWMRCSVYLLWCLYIYMYVILHMHMHMNNLE